MKSISVKRKRILISITMGWQDTHGEAYCRNGMGNTLTELEPGKNYTIALDYDDGQYESTSYTLTIGEAKESIDISDVTAVNDKMEFKEQNNLYPFTAPVDGVYRFELSEIRDEQSLYIVIYNNLHEQLEEEYCSNGEGITMELSAGKTYDVHVKTSTEGAITPYTLNIGKQKPPVDITAYDGVSDTIEFTEQDNIYEYTPKDSGSMTVSVSELTNDSRVHVRILNRLGEEVASRDCSNGTSVTVDDTNAGEKYEIHVGQWSGNSPYRLMVQ